MQEGIRQVAGVGSQNLLQGETQAVGLLLLSLAVLVMLVARLPLGCRPQRLVQVQVLWTDRGLKRRGWRLRTRK